MSSYENVGVKSTVWFALDLKFYWVHVQCGGKPSETQRRDSDPKSTTYSVTLYRSVASLLYLWNAVKQYHLLHTLAVIINQRLNKNVVCSRCSKLPESPCDSEAHPFFLLHHKERPQALSPGICLKLASALNRLDITIHPHNLEWIQKQLLTRHDTQESANKIPAES